jgi:iron complex outermembrane receptor protein
MRVKYHDFTICIIGVGLCVGSMTAYGAETPATVEAEDELTEVVVTGTSIRGNAPIGTAPVQYSRIEIEADAPASIGDALANIPQIASFGTEQQLSTTNRFRTAGFIPVIHNMEIGSTLTLFNGHRMASVGTEATFPDPSIIPTIALERVEIVADGNSALYGSDAVAGVVNFQYRRNFQGFEASVAKTFDSNTSFSNLNYGAIWGHSFGRGEVMFAAERSEHEPAFESEFPFIKTGDHRPQGGLDRRPTTTCDDPVVGFGATNYSGPNRTAGALVPCDPLNFLTIGFGNKRTSIIGTARFRPSDNLEFWAEANYSKYDEQRILTWTNIDVNVPRTSPFFWTPAGATTIPNTERVRRGAYPIFGPRTQLETSKITAVTLGSTFNVGEDWTSDVRIHYSTSNDFWDARGLDTFNLTALTASGQFNPFGTATSNSAAVLAQINNGYATFNTGSNSLTELEVKADGPLFAIGGGDVKAAVGVNHRTEGLRQVQDAGCQNAGCSFFLRQRNDNIDRGVNSAFVEFAIPVVGGSNARAGINELTFALAGRYDKYDLLKGQFTPKVAVSYKPIASLALHGTWGKSYAAPNLGLTTSTFAIVQPGSNIQGTIFDIYNLGGGNSALTPEQAKTYSFGIDWKPEFLDGFTAGINYYHVDYTNLVYKPSRDDVVFNPAFISARIVGNEATPTASVPISAAIMTQITAQYPPDRILATGQTFSLVHRSYAINLGQRTFAGLDLNTHYDFSNRSGKWGVGINANRQMVRKTQVVAGGPISNDIGSRVAPPWQVRFDAQWAATTLPLRFSWVSNYLSSYEDRFGVVCTQNPTACRIGSNLIHNLTASYDLTKVLKGLTLQARVTNLTDKIPPFYDAVQGYDNQNASPYGRQFTVSVRARF